MNLVLIRAGYPPGAVRFVDWPAYVRGLQINQAGQGSAEFEQLLYQRLDEFLNALPS